MPAKIIFAKQLFGAGKQFILSPFADNRFPGENIPLISRNVVCLLAATGFAEGAVNTQLRNNAPTASAGIGTLALNQRKRSRTFRL